MYVGDFSSKDIGNLGERVTAEYLRRKGFLIVGRNVQVKVGELDIVARKENCLHVVEVKALVCREFPKEDDACYGPGENLHEYKLRKLVRSAEWYIAGIGWDGEWQIDGAFVWLRQHDGMAKIEYLPQIL